MSAPTIIGVLAVAWLCISLVTLAVMVRARRLGGKRDRWLE